MTTRGRLTLLGLGLSVVVCGRLTFSAAVESPAAHRPAIASVSAAPAARALPLPTLPVDFPARFPVGKEILDLALGEPEGQRFVEWLPPPPELAHLSGPLRVEYSMNPELTRNVFRVLKRARVSHGHVILMEPKSGRVLTYASTNERAFPGTRAYPAASLVKIVTAAAALDHAPERARRPCRYRGNPYRLRRSQIRRPATGLSVSLERALATSNNQCFAQLAVNAVGADVLLDTIDRFGWLDPPAPGHSAGSVDPGEDEFDLGRLGCGLAGCRITPLHAAQLAATLADGVRAQPWWIESVTDAKGKSYRLPPRPKAQRVLSSKLAEEIRDMLVRTTTRGTAKSAFRDRRGRPRLGSVSVAGKTGTLTGSDPSGRYEWFIGLAPADDPVVAISVLQLQDDLWWRTSSQIGEAVLESVFCTRGVCDPKRAARFID